MRGKIRQRDRFSAPLRHPDILGKKFAGRIIEVHFPAADHIRQQQ
jgi:hypothetical protein